MTRTALRWSVLFVLVTSMFVAFAATTAAAGLIYVRSGGNDTLCNGTANVDDSAGVEPNCAVQTVGKGIALADSGGTVQVAAGTYAESVTISKPLTLNGAQAGVDARTRSGSESVLGTVSITSSGVIVDGFTFEGSRVQANGATSNILSGVVIENDIFDGYSSVGLPTYDAGNILIQQNLFENAQSASEAIQIKASADQGGCDGSQVLNNAFEAATNNGGADVNLSCTGSNSSSVTVANNTTSGNTGGSSFVGFSGVVDGISVTDNSGSTTGSSIFFFGNVTGTALVDGNSFSSGGSSVISIHGGDITSDTTNTGVFTITGNRMSANVRGIYISASALTAPAQVLAHYNEFVGNSTAGIENASSVAIDAANNWWGCNSGPNTTGCDTTTGAVTSDPWLQLTITASPSTIAPLGYPGDSSTITAGLTMNSDGVDTSGTGHVLDGTPVSFTTTDGSLSSASETTANGTASVSLTASATPSTADVSTTVDQQTVSTTVDWAVPSSTSGAHVIAMNRRNPLLQLNVLVNPTGASHGMLRYAGSDGSGFISMQITSIVVSGNQATIAGRGLYLSQTGAQFVTFRIDVTANGTSSGGTIELRLSNGYDSGVVPVEEVRM